MDEKQLIYNQVMKIKDVERILLLCNATNIFLSMYEGNYHILRNKKDIVDFIDYYDKPNDRPLVFGDISLLNELEQNYLLKFIEEASVPLIVLASKDNLSSTIMSRFLKIIKIPFSLIEQGKKFTLREFVKYKQNYKLNYPNLPFDNLEQSLRYCPEYYQLTKEDSISKNISEEVIDLCISNLE